MASAADQNQNINLLPGDLKRKREVIKKVIASDAVSYTKPQNGQTEKQPEKKKSLISFWGRKGGNILKKSTPPKPNFLRQTTSATEVQPPAVQAAPPAPEKKMKLPIVTFSSPVKKEKAPERKPEVAAVNGKANSLLPGQAETKSLGREFDVNLLSKEYAEVFKNRNQKSVFITWVVVTAAIIAFSYIGIHLYQLKKSAAIRQASLINAELEKTIATYSSLEQEDALLLKKISSLKTLLDNHVVISKFLRLLEAATTPEVTYTAIAASREGLVTITALATDFTSLGRQLSILQEHTGWIQEAQITAAQLLKDNQSKTRGVEFDLLLKVDQSVFGEPETPTP